MTARIGVRDGQFRLSSAIAQVVRALGGFVAVADYLGVNEKTVRRHVNGETTFDQRQLVALIVLERDELGTQVLADAFHDLAAGPGGEPNDVRAHLSRAMQAVSATTALALRVLEDGRVDLREVIEIRDSVQTGITLLNEVFADCNVAHARAQARSPH